MDREDGIYCRLASSAGQEFVYETGKLRSDQLRARRGLMQVLSGGWLLNVQWSSGYGNSIHLPVLWLIGVVAAGVATFTHAPLCAGQPMALKLAARLSFANIFVFLPDKRELMASPRWPPVSPTGRRPSARLNRCSVWCCFSCSASLCATGTA
jgi:hypothetical protein